MNNDHEQKRVSVSGIVTSPEEDVMCSSHRRNKFVGEPGRSKTMHRQKIWLSYLRCSSTFSFMKTTVVFDVCGPFFF